MQQPNTTCARLQLYPLKVLAEAAFGGCCVSLQFVRMLDPGLVPIRNWWCCPAALGALLMQSTTVASLVLGSNGGGGGSGGGGGGGLIDNL